MDKPAARPFGEISIDHHRAKRLALVVRAAQGFHGGVGGPHAVDGNSPGGHLAYQDAAMQRVVVDHQRA